MGEEKSTPATWDGRCPRCKSGRYVLGELVQGWVIGNSAPLTFRAFGARLSSVRKGVPISTATYACDSCGLVWSELNSADLRRHLERFEDERTRGWLTDKPDSPL